MESPHHVTKISLLFSYSTPPCQCREKQHAQTGLPCRLFPLVLVQVGGGDVCGLTTGAKALFCFTAETILAGEKEKIPEELLQLEGRLVEDAMVGLDGTTRRKQEERRIILFKTINELEYFISLFARLP